MNSITLILLALATWRVSSMFVNESGPYAIFMRIRKLKILPSEVARMLLCVWCISVWVGLAFFILYSFLPVITVAIASVLSFSAVSCIIEEFTE